MIPGGPVASNPYERIRPGRISYGWDGGLGTSWANDPAEGLVGVVLTTDMFTGAHPPPAVIQDFWTCAHAAIA